MSGEKIPAGWVVDYTEYTMQERIDWYADILRRTMLNMIGSGTISTFHNVTPKAVICAHIEAVLDNQPKTVNDIVALIKANGIEASPAHVGRLVRRFVVASDNAKFHRRTRPWSFVRGYPKVYKPFLDGETAPEPVIDATAEVVEPIPEDTAEVCDIEKSEVDHRIVDDEPAVEPEPTRDKLSTIVYGGVTIGIDGQMVDATAMWRACGSPENQKPSDWMRRDDVKAYMAKLAESLKLEPRLDAGFQLVTTIRGGLNPHTEMSRILALHFAAALDPGLGVKIDQYFLAGYDNGRAQPQQTALTREDRLFAILERQLTQGEEDKRRAEEKDRLDRERQDICLAETKANREMFSILLDRVEKLSSATMIQSQPQSQQQTAGPSVKACGNVATFPPKSAFRYMRNKMPKGACKRCQAKFGKSWIYWNRVHGAYCADCFASLYAQEAAM